MTRIMWIVSLIALAIGSVSAQSGSVRALARGGFSFIGNDGEALGTVSGTVQLGKNASADLMFVLKDAGGSMEQIPGEAIVFLLGVERSKVSGNRLTVWGPGTFQGEKTEIELTIVDATRKTAKDQVRIRVLRGKRVAFDHTASLDASAIQIIRR